MTEIENFKSETRTDRANYAKRDYQAAPSKETNRRRPTVAQAAESASSPEPSFGFRPSESGFQRHTSWLADHFVVSKRYSRAIISVVGMILCYSAAAQTDVPPADQTNTPASNANTWYGTRESGNQWRMGVSLNYSYVGSGDVSFPRVSGKSDAQSFTANALAEIPVNDKWFIPVHFDSRDFFLGTVTGAPIPDQMDTLGFDTGAGYHLNDQWTFAASIGPRLYRLDDVSGDDVGIGGTIRASWRYQPDLLFAFGLNFESDRDVPVLPAAGLRWDITPKLTLNLMWPQPGLIYHVNAKLDVFAAGGGDFTVFRTDSNLGNTIGQPAFNSALGTYRDFHIGAGAEYHLVHGLSISLEGGYSVGREIDYKDIDQTVSFGSAPYVRAGLRYRF